MPLATSARTALREAAMQSAVGAVMITDRNGSIIDVNGPFESLLGHAAGAVVGKTPAMFASGLHTRAFYREMWRQIETGKSWRGEIINRKRSGELIELRLEITGLRQPEGDITHYVATYQDITREKEDQRRLALEAREGRFVRQEIEDLIERVSDHKRETLEKLGAILAVLDQQPDRAASREPATRTRALASSIRARLDNLLKLGRAGAARKVFAPLDLDGLFQQVKEDLGGVIRRRQATIRIGTLPRIVGDRARLAEVFFILLRTALNQVDKRPHIIVKEAPGQDCPPGFAHIVVQDNGHGLYPQDRERIFRPFQENVELGRNHGRFQLAVARKIVEAHGGRLWAGEAPASGNEFHLMLPAALTAGAGSPERPQIALAVRSVVSESLRIEPARVLLIEEDAVAVQFGTRILVQAFKDRLVLETSRSLADALERLHGSCPDVIVLSFDLTDSDPYKLAARIRERFPHVPFIGLSYAADERQIVRAMQIGVNDYVTHAEAPVLLPAIVKAAVDKARADIQRDQLHTDLMGIMSHDLRNPLSTVLSSAELLAGDPRGLSAEQDTCVKRICRNVVFAIQLLQDFLDAAMIEAGKLVLRAAPHDLITIVDDALAGNTFLAADKKIRLSREPGPGPVVSSVDRSKIVQVLNNLVSNALKYSPSGSEVRVGVRSVPGAAEIRVADSGQGVAPGELDLLFRKFSRTSAHTMHGEKSTGLGLYIVKMLVDLHGGSIRVDSQAGQGSTFTVVLPDPVGDDASRGASPGSG